MSSNSEQLYDSLQKAVSNSLWVIKFFIYPITIIFVVLTAVGIWFGVNIKSAKHDIEMMQKDLEIRTREVKLTSQELEHDAKVHFQNLTKKFTSLESNIESIEDEFKLLQTKYNEVLSQNDNLFKELKADNQSLSDFSKRIRESIEEYSVEIKFAKLGAEERRKDIEKILKERNEQLEAVQKSTVLLLEYLVLMQSKSNFIPNPNIEKGIGILNRILEILIPDENERREIIQRINKTIEGE